MSTAELTNKINDLMELRRMQEELTAEIDTITDEIKTIMGDQETLLSGPWKVSWKPVTSSRIDTTALKKALPDVAAQFTRTTTTRRFTVSA